MTAPQRQVMATARAVWRSCAGVLATYALLLQVLLPLSMAGAMAADRAGPLPRASEMVMCRAAFPAGPGETVPAAHAGECLVCCLTLTPAMLPPAGASALPADVWTILAFAPLRPEAGPAQPAVRLPAPRGPPPAA